MKEFESAPSINVQFALHSALQHKNHGTRCILLYAIKKQTRFGDRGSRSTTKIKEILRQFSKASIADCFKNCFEQNCVPNNKSKVDLLNSRFTAQYEEYEARHSKSCVCQRNYISPLNIIDALGGMKCNKSADESGISAEHFHYAPLSLLL